MRLGSKNKQQRQLFLRISIGVLVLLCVLLSISVYERYTIEREMADRRAVLEAEFAELEERKVGLEERVEYLEDEVNLEAEIRRSFDVAREGEQVVIILDDEASTTTSSAEVDVPNPDPWYKIW